MLVDGKQSDLSSRTNRRKFGSISNNTTYLKVRLTLSAARHSHLNFDLGYRLIIKHLASLRLDLICSAGTGIGRR